MSGLFRRLSSRRSGGLEGTEPPEAAAPGTEDAPTNAPAEPGGRRSLLSDPAAPTEVLPGDDLTTAGDAPPAGAYDPATGAYDPSGAAEYPPVGGGYDPATGAYEPPAGMAAGAYDPDTGAYDPSGETLPGMAPPIQRLDAVYAPQPPAFDAAVGHYLGGQQPPPPVPVADLPAGVDADELYTVPATSARRGRLRRRVAFLRAARELLLRDLGGFVYELHRTAGDVEYEGHRRLRETKLTRLTRVDAELHELELRLDDVRRNVVVREPGVGGECPECGELYGSDANFCGHCGFPLTEAGRKALAANTAPEPPLALEPAPKPIAAAEPATAIVDQPTEELPPLNLEGEPAVGEFRWPQRDAPTVVESTPERDEPAAAATADEPAAEVDPEPAAELATEPREESVGEPAAAATADAAPSPAVDPEPEARDESVAAEPEAPEDSVAEAAEAPAARKPRRRAAKPKDEALEAPEPAANGRRPAADEAPLDPAERPS
jgi:hypothetical protein